MRSERERSSAESLERWLWTSVTRIWERGEASRSVLESLSKDRWGAGDYVLAEVIEDPRGRGVENATGRVVDLVEAQLVNRLTGLRAPDLRKSATFEELDRMLVECINPRSPGNSPR